MYKTAMGLAIWLAEGTGERYSWNYEIQIRGTYLYGTLSTPHTWDRKSNNIQQGMRDRSLL